MNENVKRNNKIYNEGRAPGSDKNERVAAQIPTTGTNAINAYDVVVIGGGVAGCAAALAAARNSSKVLLVEKMTVLGGLATAGHIVIYLPLDDGYGRKVISGLAEEFLEVSVTYGYGMDYKNWQIDGGRYETNFNGPVFALALEELLLKEGVDIWFDTLFVGTTIDGGTVKEIIIENKSGRRQISCKAVVDASGDAEVFARSGELCYSRENSLAIWCYCTDGGKNHISKRGSKADKNLYLLTLGNIDKSAERHVVATPYYADDFKGVNRFIMDGHKKLLSQVKEDPDLTLASLPSMPQVRMARRIEGEYILKERDASKHFEDNIGGTGDWRRPAPVYEIPFRTLYTNNLKNVIAAGRCISASEDAWEVTRVIAPAVLTGQSAGTAATLIANSGVSVQNLDIAVLRNMLKNNGVLLDVNER